MAETNEINSDLQHLNLLSIFHYVAGGMLYLFGCVPILHLVLGLVFLFAPMHPGKPQDNEAAILGFIFIFFALTFITAAWTLATMIIVTGRKLTKKKSYMFCLVIACVECIFMPCGTVLGVFTIIVLSRPSVKALFNPPAAETQNSGS
jgi:hypothetical protein